MFFAALFLALAAWGIWWWALGRWTRQTNTWVDLVALLNAIIMPPLGVRFSFIAVDSRPALEVNSEGIIDRMSLVPLGLIPWHAVSTSAIKQWGLAKAIRLTWHDESDLYRELPIVRRMFGRVAAVADPCGVWIAPLAIDRNRVEIQLAIKHHIARYGRDQHSDVGSAEQGV